MARVKTFVIHPERGLHDAAVAQFIAECEVSHYVNVTTQYVPVPTPRVTVIVTNLDEKGDPAMVPPQEKRMLGEYPRVGK